MAYKRTSHAAVTLVFGGCYSRVRKLNCSDSTAIQSKTGGVEHQVLNNRCDRLPETQVSKVPFEEMSILQIRNMRECAKEK